MKPFSGAALAARVKVHLRRYRELKEARVDAPRGLRGAP
jgi:DNA-binding response OmpR family regulator